MSKIKKFFLSEDSLFITMNDGSASQYSLDKHEYKAIREKLPLKDINDVLEIVNMKNLKDVATTEDYQLKHDLIEVKDGRYYLKNSPYPLPKRMVEIFIEKGVKEHYINFWYWLSRNPVFGKSEIHERLFEYLDNQGFQLTKHGAIVAYRNANKKNVVNSGLLSFVIGEIARTKKMKKSPSNYYVRKTEKGYERITETAFKNDSTNVLGSLPEVYDKYSQSEVYTSAHTGKEEYRVAEEYSIPWSEVDTSDTSCSRGLHFTYWSALKSHYAIGSDKLAILINPIDVGSVPRGYNGGKGRCRRFYVIGSVNEPLELNDDNVLEAFDHWMELQMEEMNVSINDEGFIDTGKLNTLNYNLDKVNEITSKRFVGYFDEEE